MLRYIGRISGLEVKEVLVLKFFEDKSYEEISDILKIPEGSIPSLKRILKTHPILQS